MLKDDKCNLKKNAERNHAKQRASERFGVELANKELTALAVAIRQHKFKFVRRESKRITVWLVALNGQEALAVYDTDRHEIVTFLPPNWRKDWVLPKEEARE